MKTEYKILIASLFIIPVSIWLFFLIELVQYENTIAQFENGCQNIREKNNHPNADCAWPGEPPPKPTLEIMFEGNENDK